MIESYALATGRKEPVFADPPAVSLTSLKGMFQVAEKVMSKNPQPFTPGLYRDGMNRKIKPGTNASPAA